MSENEPTEVQARRELVTVQSVEPVVEQTRRELASEKIIVSAPMSLAGSAQRLWRITRASDQTAYRVVLIPLAVLAIVAAWVVVVAWYVCFGLLLVPYRLLRRGSRKRKRQALQHRELLDAVDQRR